MNKRAAITFIFLILGPTIYGMKPKDQEKPQYERYTFPSCAEKFIDGFMTGKLTGDRGYSFATEEKHYRQCFANLGEEEKKEVLEGSRYSDEREVLARELRLDLSSGQLTTKYFMPEVRIVKNNEDLRGELSCTQATNLLDDLRKFNSTQPSANSGEVGSCHIKELKHVGRQPSSAPGGIENWSGYYNVYESREVPINPAIIPALEALHAAQEKLRKESPAFVRRLGDGYFVEPLRILPRLSAYLRRRAEQKASQASQQN